MRVVRCTELADKALCYIQLTYTQLATLLLVTLYIEMRLFTAIQLKPCHIIVGHLGDVSYSVVLLILSLIYML